MSRASTAWRTAASVVLAAVFVVGFLVLSTVVVVRTRVLDAGTYTDALARQDAYDRVYTEVLADPEMADVVERLLGGLEPAGAERPDPVQLRAAGTSALRLAVPPSTLRRGTEATLTAVLAYVRGDHDRLDPDVDLRAELAGVVDAAAVRVPALLASVGEQVTTSVDGYRAAVGDFAAQLASGTLPTRVPVLDAAGVDPQAVTQAVVEAFGGSVDPAVRSRVEAAVLVGDERKALVDAAAGVIELRAGDAVADLRADLEDGRAFDVVGELADRAGRSRTAVIERLDSVRDIAGWFGPATGALGVGLMVVAAAGLLVLHRASPRRALLVLAAAGVAAGVALAGVWLVVTGMAAAPLAPATGTGPGSWNLPTGLRDLVGDVEGELGATLGATVTRFTLLPIATGLAVGSVALAAPHLGTRSARTEGGAGTRNQVGAGLGDEADRGTPIGPGFDAGVEAGEGGRVGAGPEIRGAGGGGGVGRRLPAWVGPAGVGVAGVVVIVLVGLVASGRLGSNGDGGRACNGDVELCDRRYDEVAYAATHNSMSSPDVVAVWPEHDGDIEAQLDFGIRALLIDTHHWTPLVSADQLTQGESPFPPEVAERVFATLGARREPRDGAYLCHNQCALGALPLDDALATVRTFLEDNPDEVLTLIVQDAIPADETAQAFDRAGLGGYLHRHEVGAEWPTLGELIDRGERLVVFAENEGPPPSWYHQAYVHMQETPFRFESPEEMSCAPNRGPDDSPLFLLNHWVTRVTPDRATAAQVNQRAYLVERAERCEAERDRLPNFVAVDFFGAGDVIGAVDELNGVG